MARRARAAQARRPYQGRGRRAASAPLPPEAPLLAVGEGPVGRRDLRGRPPDRPGPGMSGGGKQGQTSAVRHTPTMSRDTLNLQRSIRYTQKYNVATHLLASTADIAVEYKRIFWPYSSMHDRSPTSKPALQHLMRSQSMKHAPALRSQTTKVRRADCRVRFVLHACRWGKNPECNFPVGDLALHGTGLVHRIGSIFLACRSMTWPRFE